MRIIGVEVAGGTPVFSRVLPHGADPYRLAWERGYRIIRPLSVSGHAPDLTLTMQVARHGRRVNHRAWSRTRSMDPGLELTADVTPIVRQRLAAYAIVLSPLGILATQFSAKTAVPGMWGLPGGGIDPGEAAAQAVVREVDEETGQDLEISHLLDLQTDHWIGRSPTGLIEDFHAVRIIFAGRCPTPGQPVVHDIGGTTSAAIWVPLGQWASLGWSASARTLLERHLQPLAEAWRAAG
ncbi:MAG: NUDIX domain-containing protein [Propionicimonas sp.]|nr:NUDIX domain-containing protein [Propionicimonas sp.]